MITISSKLNNPQIEINLVSGWNMIGYPCTQEVIVSDAFSSILKITIVKDNNGNVFMPEFSFNGIGFRRWSRLSDKMTDLWLVLHFVNLSNFQLLRCTDCAASNFNRLALQMMVLVFMIPMVMEFLTLKK